MLRFCKTCFQSTTPTFFKPLNLGEEELSKTRTSAAAEAGIDRQALEVISVLSPFDFHVFFSSRYVSKLFLLYQ